MKYLLGLVLMVIAMVSTAKENWHIGTWVIDAEKTKEHSQHLTGEEKKLAERAEQAASKGIYDIKDGYFTLFGTEQGVSSPKFKYKVEPTDRNTILLKSSSLPKDFELGQDAYGVYMLMSDVDYKMKDEKFGAKSYVVDENGERIKEEEVTAKAYLKEYDEEIDREHYDNYKKEQRYK
jgi:hypothetical protein